MNDTDIANFNDFIIGQYKTIKRLRKENEELVERVKRQNIELFKHIITIVSRNEEIDKLNQWGTEKIKEMGEKDMKIDEIRREMNIAIRERDSARAGNKKLKEEIKRLKYELKEEELITKCLKKNLELAQSNEDEIIWINEEVLMRAIELYGEREQHDMLLEEMAELQKEICKYFRGERNDNRITEEIADVLIMIEQVKIMHDIKDSNIQCAVDQKLSRLRNRIEKRKESEEKCY